MYSLGPYQVDTPDVTAPGYYFCEVKGNETSTFVVYLTQWTRWHDNTSPMGYCIRHTHNEVARTNGWGMLGTEEEPVNLHLYRTEIRRKLTKEAVERVVEAVRNEALLEQQGRTSIGV